MAWTTVGEGAIHVGGSEHVTTSDEAVHRGGGKLGLWVFVANDIKMIKKNLEREWVLLSVGP